MYNIIYETSRQSRFNARYWMLGAGALGTDEDIEAHRGKVDRKDDRKSKGRKDSGEGTRREGRKADICINFLNSKQPFMAFPSDWYWPRDECM